MIDTSGKTVKALFELTNFRQKVPIDTLFEVITNSPDPETACCSVMEFMLSDSDILNSKWRKAIHQVWGVTHPDIPELPAIPIAQHDVKNVSALEDALVFLRILEEKPALLSKEGNVVSLSPEEVMRFAVEMPSLRHEHLFGVEHEWNCLSVMRLRLALQALRLVRVYKGELLIVKSRYERFLSLPAAWQYYALWHSEAYHLQWADFAGQWSEYIRVLQGYLPLVWDLADGVSSEIIEEGHDWSLELTDIFSSIWEQEGLLVGNTMEHGILALYRQMTLPGVIKKLVLNDLFKRYGLIESVNDIFLLKSDVNAFKWTELGLAIVRAEKSDDLPCGVELLDA